MRKIVFVIIILFFTGLLNSKPEGSLESKRLNEEGGRLDQQIQNLNKRIADLIGKNKLMSVEDIVIVPYQMTYKIEKGKSIKMERHLFLKDPIYQRVIKGIKTKSFKLFSSGNNLSKLESKIYENDYSSGRINEVIIIDPSPSTLSTDDIIFTHKFLGKIRVESKKLKDVKNITSSPLRNSIKRDFIIPHLTVFYNALLFTANSYYKGIKDSDIFMAEFLKKSAKY